MSTATATARPNGAAPRTARRGPLRGLTWLVWRQHRAAAWSALALLLVVALGALHLHHATADYLTAHNIRGCEPYGGPPRCAQNQEAVSAYRDAYREQVRLLLLLVLAVPVLGGLFVGAPLISRELESGTHQLVWSQSVTRGRWLAHKLALPLLAITLVSAVAGALASWTLAGAGQSTIGLYWYSTLTFIPAGPAVVGYALLGVALGAAAGTILRRTVPAMATTLAGFGLAVWGLQTLRPHLVSPQVQLSSEPFRAAETTWRVVTPRPATADGRVFPPDLCHDRITSGYRACIEARGATHQYTEFHTIADMRALQFAEAGVCVLLAAALVALTCWWLRRRTV